MANFADRTFCTLDQGAWAMIRFDRIWLATEPLDMRAGLDTVLACVVKRFGKAQPHTAYIFLNKRANRMKVLVHDGFGIWLAARRLHKGKFVNALVWQTDKRLELNAEQLDALIVGLPWHYAGQHQAIEVAQPESAFTYIMMGKFGCLPLSNCGKLPT